MPFRQELKEAPSQPPQGRRKDKCFYCYGLLSFNKCELKTFVLLEKSNKKR